MSGADLVFLPWVRRGAAAAVQVPDSLGAQPGLATAAVSLTLNGRREVPVPVTVMGPSHVTGLDGRQVVRTDPSPGSRSFEPNYFPLIEFDEPALPWLFTPASAGAQARLRPWLCLVVVRLQAGVSLDPPRLGPLPVLRITRPASPAAELPDLAVSWAWAHSQVTAPSGATEADLIGQLVTDPERSIARLICPRVLAPDTDYIACVVPTFEAGRKAGLGEPITEADEARLAPAWAPDAAAVELPVYHHWAFATGAGGDFQSLAMLLRARPLPGEVGVRPIDVGDSGLATTVPVGTTLPLAGALRPVGAVAGGWPDAATRDAWEAALAPVLNAPAVVDADKDPLLAPPLYGAAQAGLGQVDSSLPARWFEALNLSPAHRAVAHLGTRVVRDQQEALMASAWAQAAELERANQLLRQTQFGCWVAASMHGRHIARMDAGVGLQVLAPAQARMLRMAAAEPGKGLAGLLFATGLDATAYDTALRRIARPRGAVNRRVQRAAVSPTPTPRTSSVLFSLQPMRVMARRVAAPVAPVSLERVAASLAPPRHDISWGEATAAAVASMPGRPAFAFVPLGAPVPMQPTPTLFPTRHVTIIGLAERQLRRRPGEFPDLPRIPELELPDTRDPGDPMLPTKPAVHSAAAAQFRALAEAHLARFNPPPGGSVAFTPMRNGSLPDAFAEALARTAPRETFAIRARAAMSIPGPTRGEAHAFEPVDLSPAFPQPMVEALTEIAQEMVLPGLDLVPPNTIVPLETNPAFVEAYMVGLNTEMGRELVWRGYPADLSATYFDRFWNAATAPERGPDIDPIASWGGRRLGAGRGAGDFVMLVRSELLRRYPDAVIYAMKPDRTEEKYPIFTGGFAPDVRYVGFDIPSSEIGDWSIVIQEHPSAPRFGIEVADDTGGATHVPPAGENAALVAQRTRQTPVRIALPAAILLGPR